MFPALGVVFLMFFGGLLAGILRSINYMPVVGLIDPDLSAYIAVFSDSETYLSLLLSLYIALVSTLLSSILAIVFALLLRRTYVGRSVTGFLFQWSLSVPHIVAAVGVLYLLSQSGTFARVATQWGLITRPAQFPELIFDPYAIGIIVTYVWKELPFIGVVVLATMQTIGEDYESVARTLGAGRWQTFRHVLLPLILPGLLSASIIVFSFTFGAFEVPAMLGASYPPALPVLAYRQYTDVDLASRPEAMVIAVFIALVCSVLVYFYMRWSRHLIRR